VRWAVARFGERELSGAGSVSEQAQLFQKPNGSTNTVLSVVRCSLGDFSFPDPPMINFASFREFAFNVRGDCASPGVFWPDPSDSEDGRSALFIGLFPEAGLLTAFTAIQFRAEPGTTLRETPSKKQPHFG
jgi:hypothetical protein